MRGQAPVQSNNAGEHQPPPSAQPAVAVLLGEAVGQPAGPIIHTPH
jgi:hypothetical protein